MKSALLLAALCVGCGHTGYRAPLTCPQRGGPQWTELTSDHFILRTDYAANEARWALADFEIAYAAFRHFARLVIPVGEPFRDKVEIYAFERSEDYEAVTGRKGGGVFAERGHDPDRVARIIMQGRLTLRARIVFQHEMTHSLVRQALADAPQWLNEGLAEYLETLQIDGARVVIGRPDRVFTTDFVNVARYRNVVSVERLPSVKELIGASWDTFHDKTREQDFYAASWALVHYLRHSPAHAPRFGQYLSKLVAGTTPDKAWSEAFGGVDLAVIDREFREQAADKMIATFTAPYRPAAAPAATGRPMSDSEVHLLFLSLRPWRKAESMAVARELADAETHGSPATDLTYWKGIFAAWNQGPAAGESHLRAALEADPKSRKRLLALVSTLYEIEKRKPVSERNLVGLKPLLKRLWAHSGDPGVANEIAWIYAEMGQPDLGLPFARLAVEKEPGSGAFLDTHAKLLADTGFIEEALDLQRRAVAAYVDDKPPTEITERLAQYEKAVAERQRGR